MDRNSYSSYSGPSKPNYQRLSAGTARTSRPIQAQAVVLAVLGLLLLAIPLYLLRRPRTAETVSAIETAAPAFGGVIRPEYDAGLEGTGVDLGPIQRAKCSARPNLRGNEGGLCDALPLLEDALRRGIKKTVACAPKTGKEGTINFVLEIDFPRTRINVFPGKSGQWRGPQARRAAQCVLRALPQIPWDALSHQYRYYMIAVLATYPAPDPLEALPVFE